MARAICRAASRLDQRTTRAKPLLVRFHCKGSKKYRLRLTNLDQRLTDATDQSILLPGTERKVATRQSPLAHPLRNLGKSRRTKGVVQQGLDSIRIVRGFRAKAGRPVQTGHRATFEGMETNLRCRSGLHRSFGARSPRFVVAVASKSPSSVVDEPRDKVQSRVRQCRDCETVRERPDCATHDRPASRPLRTRYIP